MGLILFYTRNKKYFDCFRTKLDDKQRKDLVHALVISRNKDTVVATLEMFGWIITKEIEEDLEKVLEL